MEVIPMSYPERTLKDLDERWPREVVAPGGEGFVVRVYHGDQLIRERRYEHRMSDEIESDRDQDVREGLLVATTLGTNVTFLVYDEHGELEYVTEMKPSALIEGEKSTDK